MSSPLEGLRAGSGTSSATKGGAPRPGSSPLAALGGGSGFKPKKKKGFWDKGVPGLAKGGLRGTLAGLNMLGNAPLGLIEFVRKGPTPGQTAGDVLFGKGEARDLNFRKALTGNPNLGGKGWGGKALGFGDFVATQLLDPSTYLTFGVGTLAKVGTKAAGKSLGKEAAESITRVGAKRALSPTDRLTLGKALASAEGGSEASAAKVLKALDRGGQGGIKLGGRTVVAGQRLTPLTDPVWRSRAGRWGRP